MVFSFPNCLTYFNKNIFADTIIVCNITFIMHKAMEIYERSFISDILRYHTIAEAIQTVKAYANKYTKITLLHEKLK